MLGSQRLTYKAATIGRWGFARPSASGQRPLVAALFIALALICTGCTAPAQMHWSPDGTAAAYCYRDRAVVVDEAGAILSQLGKSDGGFVWTADSKTLYYATETDAADNAVDVDTRWSATAPTASTQPAKTKLVELCTWSNRKSTPLVKFKSDSVVYMRLSPDQEWLAFVAMHDDAYVTYVCHLPTKHVYLLSEPVGMAMCFTAKNRLAYIEPASNKPVTDFKTAPAKVVEVTLDAKAEKLNRTYLLDVVAGETFWMQPKGDDLLLTAVGRTVPGKPIADDDLLNNIKLFMWTRANGGMVAVAESVGPLFALSPDGSRVMIHKITPKSEKMPGKFELMVIRTNGSDGRILRTINEGEPMPMWPAWRSDTQIALTAPQPKAITAGGEPRQQFDVVLYNLTEKGELREGKTLSDTWDPDLKPYEKASATTQK